jgi:aminoacyl tRNA synthase complex-interacting multifunctional protein 1
VKGAAKAKEGKPAVAAPSTPVESEAEPDVSRLDLRVGKIVAVKKHEDADSLYVEEVSD